MEFELYCVGAKVVIRLAELWRVVEYLMSSRVMAQYRSVHRTATEGNKVQGSILGGKYRVTCLFRTGGFFDRVMGMVFFGT